MSKQAIVIDYGIGNVFSVCNALKEIGVDPVLSADPKVIETADRVILPGVGAYSRAMAALVSKGFDDALRTFVQTGRPFLGICIGMQVLLEQSNEMGIHQGLGLIEGSVEKIPNEHANGERLLVPHISWASVVKPDGPIAAPWKGSILESKCDSLQTYYFVHSYAARPTNPKNLLAQTTYGGHQLTAAIQKDNITGVQFHPERSGKTGLKLLDRFVRM